jgi:predicted HicB family RNase H-like nuclease
MSKTERLNIRISEKLKGKVMNLAQKQEITVSELIIDCIKKLPDPED